MRDTRQTFRTFAERACAPAVLSAALLFALHATAGAALAQDKTAEGQEKVLKDSGAPRPVLNKMPLTELMRRGKQLYDEKRLGASTRIDVNATAELQTDGTFRPGSLVTTWTTSSDETATALAEQLITAVSESKVLSVLKDAKEVSVRLKLDDANALVSVSSAMPSAERARQMADGYSAMIKFGVTAKKGTREGEIYEGMRFASDDKLFTFTFEMPKERLGLIIMESLAKKDAPAYS